MHLSPKDRISCSKSCRGQAVPTTCLGAVRGAAAPAEGVAGLQPPHQLAATRSESSRPPAQPVHSHGNHWCIQPGYR